MASRAQWVRDWLGWVILAASATVAVLVVALGNPTWFTDTISYVNYAHDLTIHNFNPNLYWRTPGYPIFLIITGVIAFATLDGLFIVQALAAVLVPVAIYWSLRPLGRLPAFVAALASVLSLVPFAFILTVYPDQLYLSMLVLFTAFLLRYALGESEKGALYGIAVVTLVLALLKPIGIVLGVVALVVVLLKRRAILHAVAGTLIFLAGYVGFWLYLSSYAGALPSMLGRQVFLNVYLDSRGLDPEPALVEQVARAFDVAEALAVDPRTDGPAMRDDMFANLYGAYGDNYRQLAQAMLDEPALPYFWTLFILADVADRSLDRELLIASLREILSDPLPIASGILARYISFVVGPSWQHTQDGPAPEPYEFFPAMADLSQFAPNVYLAVPIDGSAFLQQPETGSLAQAAGGYFASIYQPTLAASYALMALGLIGALLYGRTEYRVAALVVFAVHSTNVGAMAVLVAPQFRYQVQSIPLAIMGAGVTLAWLMSLTRFRGIRSEVRTA